MRRTLGLSFLALTMAVIPMVAASAQTTLQGTGGNSAPLPLKPEATEQLFRGDLGAEFGIGCSNPGGTSGGPNDWAVGVTASLSPPFGITSVTYNVFTGNGAGTLGFVAWAGGLTPGAVLGAQSGMPLTTGNYTVTIAPYIPVADPQFFFGFNQPQTNAGMRIGVDSSSGSGFSFLQAPTCDLGSWGTLTSIGFPGDWVMAAVVSSILPVELTVFDVE